MPRDALANPAVVAVLGALLEQPMHPYQLAAALSERGVPVNRGSLYDTVEAMSRAGWVTAQPPQQQGSRPRRIPYALTGSGRAELSRRLDQQIRVPVREFPQFLGAVSHLGLLGQEGAASALRERADRLAARAGAGRQRLAQALASGTVPRLFVIEAEYALHMDRAELAWVTEVIGQIEDGSLGWPARQPSGPPSAGPASAGPGQRQERP